ncbi:hypothetical protein [Sphingomicrobium nitratireducens]|uniref:hypothetical protein n=1 Tax=Sphingomicrobium nitratireducens TaxID=2964666 RepID=UPI0022400161|nr:hypothetical protein [Sphingomicrobium nitratireducens]
MKSIPTLGDLQMRHDPAARGYHAVYREHEVNHCPGCGRTQWIIGRFSAECAFCSTALPLAEASMMTHARPAVVQHKNGTGESAWAA